jgi:uroporphyrinogen-III synthase
MIAPGALAGRRVVVTRPRDQSASLIEELEARGARPVVVPLTEIVDEPAGMAALAGVDVAPFEWIVVTSANAAHRLVDAHGDALAADGAPPLAAVGTQTAAALPGCQLVPAEQHAEGLLAELPAPATAGAAVLVVQGAEASPTLVGGLTERGWRVTAIAPYRSAPRRPTAADQLAALAADVVLFASGSAARAWVAVFGTSSPPIVVAIGPQTAAAARAAGLSVTDVAADHSVPGLVAAAERALTGGQ